MIEYVMNYDFYRRDAAGRPPARAGAGAGAGAAGAQKSLAAPSYSRIVVHSFARTHDTKTKPKSISRLGSHALSPPNLQYIYIYIYI